MRRAAPLLALWLLPAWPALPAPAPAPEQTASGPPSLVLLTLDTTRSDHLGAYGATGATTPVLDGLAARGVRYARAIAPSPLTLPAHASLLTGLDPPEHGVRENGTAVLPPDLPTLATVLSRRGYATGAFVASRVLDRRFGLDRGFDTYDDRMAAEQLGQYGYPERDAAAVSTAALEWATRLPAEKPFFLWVHFYDPHAPYQPPGSRPSDQHDAYTQEIAFVDREIGRLLAGLPPGQRVVAAVADHGEMLGEHGESGHGIFLYRAALEVPMIVAGPGIPAGVVVEETVASRRLAPTLAGLLGAGGTSLPGSSLPGIGGDSAPEPAAPEPAYSEARMPASAYGWAPLEAITDGRWRLIAAPRPELYDVAADPGEEHNLLAELGRAGDAQTGRGEGAQTEHHYRRQARRLRSLLLELEAGFERRRGAEPAPDPELEAQLRSLGYLSATPGEEGTIDPKDGVQLLAELDQANHAMRSGDTGRAVTILESLVARNPGNVPFRSRLAAAQLEAGRKDAALATYRAAVELNPRLDFLHRNLADAYFRLGRLEEARREYQLTLELNPRFAVAWLRLAEMAARAGQAQEELRLLLDAVAAGTASVAILSRLGQLEIAAGKPEAAEAHLARATELAPAWPLPWLLRGEAAENRGDPRAAAEHYRRAAGADPRNPAPHLRLGKLLMRQGNPAGARPHLERAAALAPRSAEGRQARQLLESL